MEQGMQYRSLKAMAIAVALLGAPYAGAQNKVAGGGPWVADLGNGKYRNPILYADYSDPDAIRVGSTFYMTASSFSNAPGLPLLQSTDMVNWQLVGHALPALVPAEAFAAPQPGKGVWAPSLRHHAGKFWIFYPDPDFGVYVITATDFAGPWSAPHLLLPGKGIIDPSPLWDDDGKAYLVHAWAKSRAGFNNILTLRAMDPEARTLLDGSGQNIIDGNRLPGYTTLEGPKFYKKDGYYYIFAPAGGVEHGWQSVFRSRSISGPYQDRIVMAQGGSTTNGPHQGAWVDDLKGQDWFYHFQDKGAYGRIVHLQPMRWRDGWPVIGIDREGRGTGEPVLTHDKPAGTDNGIQAPPAGDEFNAGALGVQWQWNANPVTGWHALDARKGWLRLSAQPAPPDGSVRDVPSVLTQKFPAPAFTVDTRIEIGGAGQMTRAGLVVLGIKYAWFGVRHEKDGAQLVLATCEQPAAACKEQVQLIGNMHRQPLYLRAQVSAGATVRFAYSLDGKNYTLAGQPFTASVGRWVGAQVGLVATRAPGTAPAHLDVDYFRVGR
jgi:beta-xylosidase